MPQFCIRLNVRFPPVADIGPGARTRSRRRCLGISIDKTVDQANQSTRWAVWAEYILRAESTLNEQNDAVRQLFGIADSQTACQA